MPEVTTDSYYGLLGVDPAVSRADLDRAFRTHPQRQDLTVRNAWRVLRDRFYRGCYDVYGEQQLESAGWFLDRSRAPSLHDDERVLCTPTHKLGEGDVVLLSTGALSPIHAGHIEMMELAKAAVEATGRRVAGGYMSPSHDAYVSTKRGGAAALSAPHRRHLGELAVAESDWLMIDPWESRYIGLNVNFTDVYEHLQRYLEQHVEGRSFEVYYVFGADNAGFARAFVRDGGCVCIARAGSEHMLDQLADDPHLDPRRVILARTLGQHASVSSSGVRGGGVDGLPPVLRDTTSRYLGTEAAVADSRWYAIRDDRVWAASDWRAVVEDPEALDVALEQFANGACQAIESAFLNVTVPDASRTIRVRLLDVDQQSAYVAQLMKTHSVLSLDTCTPATVRLSLSRLFGISDGQVRASDLIARPQSPSLQDQASRIPAGEYLLLDDDIASGYTMNRVRELLPDTVRIIGEVSLLRDAQTVAEADAPLDVIDLRDLLLGARDSGLVVQLPDGTRGRAPYLAPYVNMTTRAKTPPSAAMNLSRRMWELNRDLHAHTGLRVMHCDPGMVRTLVRAGFKPQDSLHTVCVWHLQRLRRLPFSSH